MSGGQRFPAAPSQKDNRAGGIQEGGERFFQKRNGRGKQAGDSRFIQQPRGSMEIAMELFLEI